MKNNPAPQNPYLKCEVHPDSGICGGCFKYAHFRKEMNKYLNKLKSINLSSKATPTRGVSK